MPARRERPICKNINCNNHVKDMVNYFCSKKCRNEHPISEETRKNMSEAHIGHKHTDESKKKIGEASKKRIVSEETKIKMSNSMKGKKCSDEARKNMSLGSLGKVLTEEHKRNISNSTKGVKKSEETKKKMSDRQKGDKAYWYGKTPSEETRKKISESNKGKHSGEKNYWYGKKFSDEHRKKIALANTGRITTEETREKLRKVNIGRKHTPESIDKIIDANRKRNKGRNGLEFGVSKSEKAFVEAIEEKYNVVVDKQFKLERGIFDIKYKNYLIEVDGSYWHSLEKAKIRDERKNKIAKENGYTLIRISLDEAKYVPKVIEENLDLLNNIFLEK